MVGQNFQGSYCQLEYQHYHGNGIWSRNYVYKTKFGCQGFILENDFWTLPPPPPSYQFST